MDGAVAVLGISQNFHDRLHPVQTVGPCAVSVGFLLQIREMLHVADHLVERLEFHEFIFYSNAFLLSTVACFAHILISYVFFAMLRMKLTAESKQ